ncbi:hypothetical protein BJV74DRAFT_870002 [Russula compacta]|nr:hypothetical protein BJV74DRAFT_870002 [Russula compacta]
MYLDSAADARSAQYRTLLCHPLILMSIAATRMYRSLADFVSDATGLYIALACSSSPRSLPLMNL